MDANWLGIMTGLCMLLEGLIVTGIQCKWPHMLKDEAKSEVRSCLPLLMIHTNF